MKKGNFLFFIGLKIAVFYFYYENHDDVYMFLHETQHIVVF